MKRTFSVHSGRLHGTEDQFDYRDLYDAQTMLLRIGNVALVVTFNDACGAINGTMPRLERIEGPLSEIQAREVMVDFAFVNLHIKERPKFYTECIMEKEKVTEKAIMPDQFELGELNYSVRGRLMRHALGPHAETMRAVGKSAVEVQAAIDGGHFTVLFDENGKFIKESMGRLSDNGLDTYQ